MRFFILFFLVLYTFNVCGLTAFYLTPYHLIDSLLKTVDQTLGFYSDHVLVFMQSHLTLNAFLWFIYKSLALQVIFCLLIIGLLGAFDSFYRFLIQLMICASIGVGLAFFFPSLDPADTYNHINFNDAQMQDVLLFDKLHHLLAFKTSTINNTPIGTIGFPSFHVIFTILSTYTLKRWKGLFYPACIFSVFIILSTLSTGWHYLTDVIGGLSLACLSIALTSWLFKQFKVTTLKVAWKDTHELTKFKSLSLQHKIEEIILDISMSLIISALLVITVLVAI